MDTTAASHLSLHGYARPTSPQLERLAAEGAIFRQAFSTAPWTLPSHASLFTGLYPAQHGANFAHPHLNESVPTLAEILRGQGYRTVGFSNNAWVGDNTGLHRGFERFTKVITWNQKEDTHTLRIATLGPSGYSFEHEKRLPEPGLGDSGAATTNQLIRRDLADHDWAETPLFLFVNFLEPHLPYRPPAGFGKPMFAGEKQQEQATRVRQDVHAHETGIRPLEAEELSLLGRLYDGEVAYLDHRVGELVDFLREQGILDDTLLVVTADHGEQVGDHGFLGHNLNVYDDLLHVPLIVRYPALFPAGLVIDDAVQTRDVFSSVLSVAHPAALGALPPGEVHPLPTRPGSDAENRALVAEYDSPVVRLAAYRKRWPEEDFSRFDRTITAIRFQDWKLIVGSDGKRELYHVGIDPREQNDLVAEETEKVRQLENRLSQWAQQMRETMPVAARDGALPPVDEETRKKLQALGYIN